MHLKKKMTSWPIIIFFEEVSWFKDLLLALFEGVLHTITMAGYVPISGVPNLCTTLLKKIVNYQLWPYCAIQMILFNVTSDLSVGMQNHVPTEL